MESPLVDPTPQSQAILGLRAPDGDVYVGGVVGSRDHGGVRRMASGPADEPRGARHLVQHLDRALHGLRCESVCVSVSVSMSVSVCVRRSDSPLPLAARTHFGATTPLIARARRQSSRALTPATMALSKAVMPAMAAAVARGGLRSARAATRLAPKSASLMAPMQSRMSDMASQRRFSSQALGVAASRYLEAECIPGNIGCPFNTAAMQSYRRH